MDMTGGCCIARYQNGNVYDMSKVDRIMLKFRPIAPKPVAGSPTQSNEQTSSKFGRGKRKYNKENNNNNNKQKRNNTSCRKQKASSEKKISISNRRKKSNSSEEAELTRKTSSDSVVTLSLLPETPERKETISIKEEKSQSPSWLSFAPSDGGHVEKRTAVTAPVKAVMTSIVTVECMTDTWLDGNLNYLGCNDHERMVNLGKDTSPGFISDDGDQVVWTNKAYGEMVGGEEVIVWLVMKERVFITCDTFSCRVRVRSTCREGNGAIMTFPCDVWRMDGGGFAWRFDVEAALSLGVKV